MNAKEYKNKTATTNIVIKLLINMTAQHLTIDQNTISMLMANIISKIMMSKTKWNVLKNVF